MGMLATPAGEAAPAVHAAEAAPAAAAGADPIPDYRRAHLAMFMVSEQLLEGVLSKNAILWNLFPVMHDFCLIKCVVPPDLHQHWPRIMLWSHVPSSLVLHQHCSVMSRTPGKTCAPLRAHKKTACIAEIILPDSIFRS